MCEYGLTLSHKIMCWYFCFRYGKPLAIDMMDMDMFDTISEQFNKIYEGLMDDILSNEVVLKDK